MRILAFSIALLLVACQVEDPAPVTQKDLEPVKFRIAVLADTHIIDDFYEGPENTPLDTESIFLTQERFDKVRQTINAIQPAVEMVFIAGDFIHNYPSADWNFFFEHETRWDLAKGITDGFAMPVYPGLGNHDYDVPAVSREFTHELFKLKFDIEPYYAVKHQGWKFINLNNMLGDTWNLASPRYDRSFGSFGLDQLRWLDEELAEGLPSLLFFHYGLFLIEADETGDAEFPDLFAVLKKHEATVKLVLGGHTHTWINFQEKYGVRHFLLAATRYDANNYLVLEFEAGGSAYEILNEASIRWASMFANETVWAE
jgi:hypothetical protein